MKYWSALSSRTNFHTWRNLSFQCLKLSTSTASTKVSIKKVNFKKNRRTNEIPSTKLDGRDHLFVYFGIRRIYLLHCLFYPFLLLLHPPSKLKTDKTLEWTWFYLTNIYLLSPNYVQKYLLKHHRRHSSKQENKSTGKEHLTKKTRHTKLMKSLHDFCLTIFDINSLFNLLNHQCLYNYVCWWTTRIYLDFG